MSYSPLSIDEYTYNQIIRPEPAGRSRLNQILNTILKVVAIITLVCFIVLIICFIILITMIKPVVGNADKSINNIAHRFNEITTQIVNDSDNITSVLNIFSSSSLNIARVGLIYMKEIRDGINKIVARIE